MVAFDVGPYNELQHDDFYGGGVRPMEVATVDDFQNVAPSELDHEQRALQEHMGAGIAKLGFVAHRVCFEEIVR
ncbi:hypothetical protein SAMN05444161_6912 [Rhizobiales bacterium GAS191]|nr:hypothetical protein SAMN05444161_6912 [Rhizobiales bacterium GAS191]